MSDPRDTEADVSERTDGGHGLAAPTLPWRVAALGAGGAGVFMLATGRGSLSLGVLLVIAGLAATGVLLGSGPQGPEVEGRLDLSARLGLGLLGGVLGALASVAGRWLVVEAGVADALGVVLSASWTAPDLLAHLGSGAVWGLMLGVLWSHLPGLSPGGRGALFSLIPSLYVLLKVYPLDRDLGLAGAELGTWTFAIVIALNLLWGVVAGASVGWGEVAEEAPVARPIDA